ASFERIKDDVMIPFAEKYLDAADAIDEAKKAGETPSVALPKPDYLKDVAAKEGLQYELTPLLSRENAEKHGLVSGAEVGLTRGRGGKRFADEVFAAKSTLFEPIELTDFSGHRFLVRKLQDQPPRVPALDEIRPAVELAWKTEQARPLAKKAAEAFAESVRK